MLVFREVILEKRAFDFLVLLYKLAFLLFYTSARDARLSSADRVADRWTDK